MRFASLLAARAVEPGRIRQEIFSLGDRHRGDALAGALLELQDASLTGERRALLGAVVEHLRPTKPEQKPPSGARTRGDPAARPRSNLIYLVVIAASAAWITLVAQGLSGG